MLTRRWALLRGKENKLVKDLKETTLSFKQLGEKYGVSRQAIHAFHIRQGIKRPRRARGHQTEGNRGLRMGRPNRDRIHDEVLDEIFPKKLKRGGASEEVYSQLKRMILTGKLKKGERLSYERIIREFDVSRDVVHGVISHLKKDRLVISKRKVGSFVG